MTAPVVLVVEGSADAATLRRAAPGADIRVVPGLPAGGASPAVAVVLRSGAAVGTAQLAAMPGLRMIVRAGSGVDGIDLDAVGRHGVQLRRFPGASADAVAEWVLLALLMLNRRAALGALGLRAGRHLKAECLGVPAAAQNVAVWGAGPVGRAAARALRPHTGAVRFAAWPGLPDLPAAGPAELRRWADVHVLALPLRPATARIVDAGWLAETRGRQPQVICAGRLGCLDFDAALGALRRGEIAGLAVDPVDPPDVPMLAGALAEPLNLFATPHLGAQRTDVREVLDRWVATQIAGLIEPARAEPARAGEVR